MDVKTLCLGVLSLEKASGYDIKKKIQDGPIGQFHAASFGSIYPPLGALCNDWHATMRREAQDGKPNKKVYAITSAGRHTLMEAIMVEPAADRIRSEFLFIAYFGELLAARDHDALIESRLVRPRDQLRTMTEATPDASGAGARFVNGLGRAICRAQIDHIEAQRHELVAAALARV